MYDQIVYYGQIYIIWLVGAILALRIMKFYNHCLYKNKLEFKYETFNNTHMYVFSICWPVVLGLLIIVLIAFVVSLPIVWVIKNKGE